MSNNKKHDTASDFQSYDTYPIITIGIVEDVSDATQMGRMKVRCHSWLDGDVPTNLLPNVRLSSAFFGFISDARRGVNEDASAGPVAYGQWTVPRVGSQVIVTMIDNDPNQRVFLGSVPELFLSHTLPHGRYMDDRIPKTSSESNIEPLATNTGTAFAGRRDSSEYATRAMDRQVSAFPPEEFGNRISASTEADVANQVLDNPDGTTTNRTNGYVNGNSAIYSTTTPGFHSMSMDDDPNNCRMRFRTTSGNQIIMDDTNERIYISTATGKTWIEIDQSGTIDIYGKQDISISSDADVNIRAKENVRISGGAGIHLTSGNDIRMHAREDMSIRTDGDLKIHNANMHIEVDDDMKTRINGTSDTSANSIIIGSDSTYDLSVESSYTMQSNNYDFNGIDFVADGSITASIDLNAGANVFAGANVNAAAAVIAGGAIAAGAGVTALGGISAAGTISATGSIFTSGLLTSTVDVVAGNASLRSHVHMVPLPLQSAGLIPSAPPTPTAASIPPVPATPPIINQPIPPVPATPTVPTADVANALPAYFPSRIPQHEPYARTYLDKELTDIDTVGETTLDLFDAVLDDIDSVSEYPSDNRNVGTGSVARGKDFMRNSKWRR